MSRRQDLQILRNLAYKAAQSPDPSTQNAACIFDPETHCTYDGQVNRFPRGIKDTPDKWERPGKYDRVVHSEVNAILSLARSNVSTQGKWLYALWAACGPCSSVIVEAGIKRLVTLESSDPDWQGVTHERWADSIRIGFETMREAGVEIVFYPHPVASEGITVLRDGKAFRP